MGNTVYHFPAICEKIYDTEFLDEEHVFGFIFVTKKMEDSERLLNPGADTTAVRREGGRPLLWWRSSTAVVMTCATWPGNTTPDCGSWSVWN